MKILNQKPKELRYILYARKSTTSEDRQVASIKSQIEVMTEVAREHDLHIVKVMSESCSGYHPGRKVFNEMISLINQGEADGIISWKLSRLSRNPDDAGTLMGMVQRSQIKHIRTVDRNWFPEDNVMMMYVEFGINNQYSKDLSLDTRRGLTKKAERGWYPIAVLPQGYKHAQYKRLGEDEIITTDDFGLIQEGLKAVASKRMSAVEAHKFLKSMGLKGKRSNALPLSTWYSMLVDPFYAGSFEYPKGSGNIYKSEALKAISEEEFDAIQVVLGRKSNPRPKKHFLPYTGLMTCGECGCAITAEKKKKVQKNGNTHNYVYYRCTKKKIPCSQPCTNVTKLETQFKDILARIEIPQAFHEWALQEIKQDIEKQIKDRGLSIERARKSYDETLKVIDNLVEKYVEGNVPEDFYKRKLSDLEEEKKTRFELLNSIDQRVDEKIAEIDEDLDFAVTAKNAFENGNDHQRKAIVSRLGSNLVLTNHVLDIKLKKPLKIVEEMAKEVVEASKMFEPLENIDNSEQFKLFLSENPVMGG